MLKRNDTISRLKFANRHRKEHNRVKVSVIIPALNEAENLPIILPRIPDWVHEVILVDGHSTDGTTSVARQYRPDVKIVAQRGPGKGSALRTGFEEATGEIIVMLDADGSTDPMEIPMYCALLADADFVKGSRFLQGGGTADMELFRRIGNWGLNQIVCRLFGVQFSDLCYGYMAFWKRILPELKLDGEGFEIETMMSIRAHRAGLKIAEVPSFEFRRIYGQSHLRAIPDGWRVLKTIVREASGHYRERLNGNRAPSNLLDFELGKGREEIAI